MANLVVERLGELLEVMDPGRFWLLHAGIVGAAGLLLEAVAVWGRTTVAGGRVTRFTGFPRR